MPHESPAALPRHPVRVPCPPLAGWPGEAEIPFLLPVPAPVAPSMSQALFPTQPAHSSAISCTFLHRFYFPFLCFLFLSLCFALLGGGGRVPPFRVIPTAGRDPLFPV